MTVDAVEAAERQVGLAEQVSVPEEGTKATDGKAAEQHPRSALQASIEEKRDRSYYYAHAPRQTSEEPAPPPVPVVLERTVAEVPPAIVTIFNYAWADEGEVIKVYVPLEGVGAACSDEDIRATFEARLLQVDVHGLKPRQVHRLLVSKLSGDISADGSRVRKLANKLVVTLKKVGSHKWYNLKSA